MNTKLKAAARAICDHVKQAEALRGDPLVQRYWESKPREFGYWATHIYANS